MASSNRIAAISSLAGAIVACFPVASIGAPSDRDVIAAQTTAELALMRATVIDKCRRQHPTPIPQHPATTIPVTSCADDGSPGTLRAVLESVSTGDVVDLTAVPCDTITLTAGYIVPNLAANDFTIQGPGRDGLTISGGHKQQLLQDVEYGIISINDLTIADGFADDSWGGCLLAFLPTAGFRLTRVTVTGCEAHQATIAHGSNVHGGAIMAGGTVELTDSLVTGNTLSSELRDPYPYSTGMYGGGVSSIHGPVTIDRSSITSNQIVSTVPTPGTQAGGGLSIQFAV
jgi:hypothetical protein